MLLPFYIEQSIGAFCLLLLLRFESLGYSFILQLREEAEEVKKKSTRIMLEIKKIKKKNEGESRKEEEEIRMVERVIANTGVSKKKGQES